MPFLKEFFKRASKQKNIFYQTGLLAIILILCLLSYTRVFDLYENILLDLRYRMRPLQPYSSKIILIEIANDTLEQFKKWPLPRDYHASLVDVLTDLGARQVFFDIFFVEPTKEDRTFARSIKKSGHVFLPYVLKVKEITDRRIRAQGYDARNTKIIAEAVKAKGHINAPKDSDGKVRWAPLVIENQGQRSQHVTLKMICDYYSLDCANMRIFDHEIILDDFLTIPVAPDRRLLVNLVGRWEDSFLHYSYKDILFAWKQMRLEGKEPMIDLDPIKDAICLVALTATGTPDVQPVAIQNDYPLVGLHANIMNSFLLNRFVLRANRWLNLALLVLISLAVVLAVNRLRDRPFLAFVCLMKYLLFFSLMSFSVFIFSGIWVDLFYPLIIMILIYTALRVHIFMKETRQRELIERELGVAKQIQESFLPNPKNQFHSLMIASSMTTAKHVGGDLFDFCVLDDDRIGILLGDVSGKGVAASLTMARTMSFFRMIARNEDSASHLMAKLNNEMVQGMKSGVFVTATYLIYNQKAKEILLASAGHSPTPIYRRDSESIEKIEPEEGMPLGLMEDVDFSQSQTSLKKGDILILYTDGASEAMNLKREEYSEERLFLALKRLTDQNPTEIMNGIRQDIKNFTGKAPVHDDCTLIILKQG